jgi:hypothetical protein
MTFRRFLYLSIVVTIFIAVTYELSSNDFTGPDYIPPPVQTNLQQAETIVIEGDEGPVTLELLATYDINAAVKSTINFTSDFSSQISPRDLALAWADINQQKYDRYISYSQKDRWYYFTVRGSSNVDIDYVDLNSANTHIIPANQDIESTLMEVKTDDYITMKGYLVNAVFSNGSWKTSLVREDTGDGSCEIMYVTDIVIHE